MRVSQRLYNELRRYPQIRMLVIYTADVKRGSTNPVMDIGSNRFEITEAFLSEIDTEEVWSRITRKVQQDQSPDSKEMMELIVYPLAFESREDKQNAIGKVIGLVGMIKEDDVKRFVLKCLLVFTDKIILDEDAKRIEEALMVTKVEKIMYEKEAVRIAKNFLEDGEAAERVVKNTGLPIETITELYKSIEKEKQLVKN